MRAHLRQARISPKKANLIAAMVRGAQVSEALGLLERLPKKGARMLHQLISSAIANAQNNASQDRNSLFIRTLIVNKGPAYRRYIPIARGRARPIDKWTSHITVELGVVVPEGEKGTGTGTGRKDEKKAEKAEKAKKPEKKSETAEKAEYSASKPVEAIQSAQTAGDDPHATKPEEHGTSTFETQRKGSRGS